MPSRFEKFSERARKVLSLAQEEARRRQSAAAGSGAPPDGSGCGPVQSHRGHDGGGTLHGGAGRRGRRGRRRPGQRLGHLRHLAHHARH